MTIAVLRGALTLSGGAVCTVFDGEEGRVDDRHLAGRGWESRVQGSWKNEEVFWPGMAE